MAKKVEWIEYASTSFIERVYEIYLDANSGDFDVKRKGNIIGCTNSFFSGDRLIVMCDDRVVRSVPIGSVKIIE